MLVLMHFRDTSARAGDVSDRSGHLKSDHKWIRVTSGGLQESGATLYCLLLLRAIAGCFFVLLLGASALPDLYGQEQEH
ncbi:MAG: hypothetical protein MUC61_02595 [Amoebophilaceae bacterium]|nr:hypothetical protein [Amoebophilaceae bacterium]